MNFKSEKGITGIDITVAILIITIFVALLSVLFYNINVSSKTIERKTEATNLAVDTIEEVKNCKISEVTSYFNADNGYSKDNSNPTKYTKNNDDYKITVTIQDISEIDSTKTPGLVAKATIKVSYMDQNKEQDVTLETNITNQ